MSKAEPTHEVLRARRRGQSPIGVTGASPGRGDRLGEALSTAAAQLALTISLGSAGCSGEAAAGHVDPPPAPTTTIATTATVPSPAPESGTLDGFCEASAVVPWEGGYLVADNEDTRHLYALDANMRSRKIELDPAMEVADAEALARLPTGLLIVGSQSTNSDGEAKPKRERVQLRGKEPLAHIDLSACSACERARGIAPNLGGLDIEGATWWRGALWLGVRSPLANGLGRAPGRAMLLEMEGDATTKLEATTVVALDLGGFGVRDLVVNGDALLILAGPANDERAPHQLYRLASPESTPEKVNIELPPFAEGIAPTPDGAWLVVTDGDGKPGTVCKTPATWQKIRF